jgi:TRAP-type C4-dicarboxylate transport system substrate-binding protein
VNSCFAFPRRESVEDLEDQKFRTELSMMINRTFEASFQDAWRTESARVGAALRASTVDGDDERMDSMNQLQALSWSIWPTIYRVG